MNDSDYDGVKVYNSSDTLIDETTQPGNTIKQRQADDTYTTSDTTDGAMYAPDTITGYDEPIYIYEMGEKGSSTQLTDYNGNYVMLYVSADGDSGGDAGDSGDSGDSGDAGDSGDSGDAGDSGDSGDGGDGGDFGGYYDTAIGLTGDTLKSELHNIIDGHTELSYSDAWDALKDTDEDPNNSNNVILLYTLQSRSKSLNGGGNGDGYLVGDWNREHVWAKSHGGFDTNPPAGTDVHHLRPTDCDLNGRRSSKDFDSDGTAIPDTLCFDDADSFQPPDEVKGDVARMMFYMVVRYEGTDTSYDLELVDYTGTSGPIFGKLSTLLQWHIDDPVSDWERQRNDRIYQSWQYNRNPFIDHPEWVAEIWGNPKNR